MRLTVSKPDSYHHPLSRIKNSMVLSSVPENKPQEHNTRWFNQLHSPNGRRIQQHWESTLRFWFGACNWHLVNSRVPTKESSVLLTWYTKLAKHCTWHKTAISLTILSFMVWCQRPRFISCMHYSYYFQHLKVHLQTDIFLLPLLRGIHFCFCST